MTHDLVSFLTTASAIGAALAGGIFFTFSNFVMAALRRLPAEAGAAAMQSINVTVLNPLFFAVFFGTGAVALASAVLSTGMNTPPAAAGAALYLLGCIGVTAVKNVPLNNALAAADPADTAGQEIWTQYLNRWTFWNHIRTAACLIAALLLSGTF